jgi:hypothetical protein
MLPSSSAPRFDTTGWRIGLEPVGNRTKIVQTYDVDIPPVLAALYWWLIKAQRD